MNLRRVVGTVGVMAVFGALAYHVGSAAPADNESKGSSKSLRYAQAHLRLAELTLQRAQEINRRVPGTLSAAVITQFSNDVEFAKVQLEVVTKTGHADPFQEWLTRVEVSVRTAETRLKKALEARKISASAVSDLDLERMRLGVEISQLQFDRGKALANGSPEAKLRWELEMINDGLARVQEQTSLISQNRLPEF